MADETCHYLLVVGCAFEQVDKLGVGSKFTLRLPLKSPLSIDPNSTSAEMPICRRKRIDVLMVEAKNSKSISHAEPIIERPG